MQTSSRLMSFRLVKFSRATDVFKGVDHFGWQHYTHDLSISIEIVATAGHFSSSQVLKVYQGAEVVELVPVQELIGEAEGVLQETFRLKKQVKNDDLPISAIVQRPLFAFRYNLPNGKV
ncbi:hypothetical protein M011DRAFT_465458 [Sporormia fimetaria CBS 119925]|uniref:Uncharacterized protein n=1 Tax=Sporormia fimetaria CBS 119925 TaxID=1340428 RepID=A0A6A6VJ08_9PLEO|nr:hypothetical protein M011DRAFT_465458 [Sporormia fimetaria CBS 119925]